MWFPTFDPWNPPLPIPIPVTPEILEACKRLDLAFAQKATRDDVKLDQGWGKVARPSFLPDPDPGEKEA